MKKLLAVLLAAVLMLAACCFAEGTDVTGEWYLNKMAYGEEEASASDLGITMTIVLNEDGTALMESEAMEVLEEGAWAVNGEGVDLTFDGETVTATFEDGCLVLAEDEETKLIFGREAPEAFVAPEAALAEDIADFDGTWTVTTGAIEGRYISADLMLEEIGFMLGGSEPTIIIENGVVTAFGSEESETFGFEEGQLVLAGLEDEEIDLDGLLDQSVVLNADGTITYTLLGMQFYCEKAA